MELGENTASSVMRTKARRLRSMWDVWQQTECVGLSGVWPLTEVFYMMDGDEEREEVAHQSGRTWIWQLLMESDSLRRSRRK